MLGFLPVREQIRRLTALFFGLGTVFWYTSVIGSTWFWAHVVAVGCLLMSVGLALSVDRKAAEPRPIREAVGAIHRFSWPGGWSSVAVLFALGAVGELLFVLIVALWWFSRRRDGRLDRAVESLWIALSTPESVQVAAGILFGLAVTARLTILLLSLIHISEPTRLG